MEYKFKGTPGPYFISQPHATIYIEARLPNGLIQEIAAIGPTETQSQREANAHLFYAAHDLLESLVDLLDRYTGLVNCGDCGFWNPEQEKEVIKARSAIEKALGLNTIGGKEE